ncbi:MAG: hypothetical protein AAGA86_15995, partial [Bacteroidota bacterium]
MKIIRPGATAKNTFVLAYGIGSLFLGCAGQAQVFENQGNEEKNGELLVEAEDFYRQSKTDIRKWYVISPGFQTDLKENDAHLHTKDAGKGTYIEILPDSRTNHDDPLRPGVNFSNAPGKLAVVHYKVKINNPGRYYIWVRAHSVNSEDNGVHVGLNGEWPASGQRMQWCEGKHSWYWDSRQRTDAVHCGEPGLIYLDIDTPGEHEVLFSMREDGFEMDQWMMTKNKDL